VFFIFGILLVSLLFFMPVFPSFMLIDWLGEARMAAWLQSDDMTTRLARYFLLACPPGGADRSDRAAVGRHPLDRAAAPEAGPLRGAQQHLLRQVAGQPDPGIEPERAARHLRHRLFAPTGIVCWAPRSASDAEISTALGVVPDMLTLGDETFIADAVMLGDEQIDGGWMTMQPTVISRRSFVGNGAYIPDGTVLPEQVLIGVHSRAPHNAQMNSGDTWLGSPPINLPAREADQRLSGIADLPSVALRAWAAAASKLSASSRRTRW
jgi:hypothetical protein